MAAAGMDRFICIKRPGNPNRAKLTAIFRPRSGQVSCTGGKERRSWFNGVPAQRSSRVYFHRAYEWGNVIR